MNKDNFFDAFNLKTADVIMRSGRTIQVHELSLGERSDLIAIGESLDLSNEADLLVYFAHIVVKGVACLESEDLEQVKSQPMDDLIKIAEKILEISDMAGNSEKNDSSIQNKPLNTV